MGSSGLLAVVTLHTNLIRSASVSGATPTALCYGTHTNQIRSAWSLGALKQLGDLKDHLCLRELLCMVAKRFDQVPDCRLA